MLRVDSVVALNALPTKITPACWTMAATSKVGQGQG